MGYGSAQGAGIGESIRLFETGDPADVSNVGTYYVSDVSGAAEGWYEDDQDRKTQITSAGSLNVAAATFVGLTDSPASFTGAALDIVRVNAGATAVEFVDETSDFLTQYILEAGRAGNRTWVGSTDSAGTVTIRATSHIDDGHIIFETDPTTERGRFLNTGELLLGRTTLFAAGDLNEVDVSENASRRGWMIRNANTGTSAAIIYQAVNDAGASVALQLGSAAHSTLPNTAQIQASSAVTLQLATAGANPIIAFSNNLDRGRILSTGEFPVNTTAVINATDIVSINTNENATSTLTLRNSNTGASALTTMQVQNDAGVVLSMSVFSSGFAAPSIAAISASDVLLVQTSTADELVFETNSTERFRVLAAANTLQGNAGCTLQGGSGVHTLTLSGGAGSASTVTIGSSDELIGLYAIAAVAQHSSTGQTAGFTAGAGTSVLDDSTFTGGTGASAYTLGDVVRALKLFGLMAA